VATGVEFAFQKERSAALHTRSDQRCAICRCHGSLIATLCGCQHGGVGRTREGPIRCVFFPVLRELPHKYPPTSTCLIPAGENDEPNYHVRDTLLAGCRNALGHGVNPDRRSVHDDQDASNGPLQWSDQSIITLLSSTQQLSQHPFRKYLRTWDNRSPCRTDDREACGTSNMSETEFFVAVKEVQTCLGRNRQARPQFVSILISRRAHQVCACWPTTTNASAAFAQQVPERRFREAWRRQPVSYGFLSLHSLSDMPSALTLQNGFFFRGAQLSIWPVCRQGGVNTVGDEHAHL